MDGGLAGESSCIVFMDGGNPEKAFNVLLLVWNECLVIVFPGVQCL